MFGWKMSDGSCVYEIGNCKFGLKALDFRVAQRQAVFTRMKNRTLGTHDSDPASDPIQLNITVEHKIGENLFTKCFKAEKLSWKHGLKNWKIFICTHADKGCLEEGLL